MARTKEELAELLENLKDWYRQDFRIEYKADALKAVMEQLLEDRMGKFLYRRIGHLPDADFISFVKIFLDDAEPKSPVVPEVKPEAKQAEVLNVQKKTPKGK